MMTQDHGHSSILAGVHLMNAQAIYDRYKDCSVFLSYTIGTHYEYEGMGPDGEKFYLTVTAIGITFYPAESVRSLIKKAESVYITIRNKTMEQGELIHMGVRPVDYPDNVINMAAYRK